MDIELCSVVSIILTGELRKQFIPSRSSLSKVVKVLGCFENLKLRCSFEINCKCFGIAACVTRIVCCFLPKPLKLNIFY